MPVVKGGVWTNIEDEILKASVSKYGLNQWARVSSLLARKTPKQCKARWNEWLDPSIKKIEWSKEEDEKLLHLAKIMPTQWRTIAPIVGRTANQCLERYQKLLDEAEARESSTLGLTGPEGGETQAPSAADTRRLRPGELDPDPETKPARPDTIDLDEDEKEMLSEARARLANTQGKKAKRKARERQQEESRRLASLQKRRELKTAGINIKVVTRKKGEMDYNADIPFEKKAAPGFYDTLDELSRNELQRQAFDPRKQQLATKRKGDGDEDGERKRRKNEKEGMSDSQKAAIKAGQMQKLREAEQNSKRRALNLPAPQVNDGELEEIIKMGKMGEAANTMARESDNDATRGLVNSYSTLNTNAPIRTPKAPAQEDHIANEIRNIRALNETKSALLGGENTPLHEGAGSTGFEGIAPRKQTVATPNPMSTPLRGANGVGATPGRPGQTPMRTPRDTFALNQDGAMTPTSATPRDVRMHEMAARNQVRAGLASLPRPKDTEWEFEIPDDQQETGMSEEARQEDAAERDRRERERREAEEELERRRRSQVMQRGLPRPLVVDLTHLAKAADQMTDPAAAMIAREAAALVAHDASKYPLPGSELKGTPHTIDHIDDSALADARLLILSETKPRPSLAEIQGVFDGRAPDSTLLGLGCYNDDEEEQKSAMRAAFDSAQDSIMASAEEGTKMEKKLALHLGGYQKRQKMLKDKVKDAWEALEKARNALGGFQTLAISEDVAVTRRLEALREEVSLVTRRERQAQDEFRKVRDELDALRAGGVNGYH
ncbi:pre-mRNA splicing factor component domain-containing protein [Hirsutella rhossiliensis]|uniref:Pre-mRNA splicing factor component domain-containing protein n=1 Tax=Hirsutella rhossiliensis TaxID=111463 RepID=A0A9P8N455_9HYPO|nr:pre-mRNA splicing factor component domain-containing protein [Hirsutella rhossiliensis]KAH0965621.1 pre-mRNA splicing factor component domain-containing protein [Hirsutella rhossiliensis]